MPSSAWAFSLRRPANDYDSDSDTDQPPPPTVEEQVQQELDLSSREDHAKFKSTPWTIAKVNAAARSEALPEKPPPPAAPAPRSKALTSGPKARGTLQFPVVKRPRNTQKKNTAQPAFSDVPLAKEKAPAPRPFPLFAEDSSYNTKPQQSPRSVDPSSDDAVAPALFPPPETDRPCHTASAISTSVPRPAPVSSPQLQAHSGSPTMLNASCPSELDGDLDSLGLTASPAKPGLPPPTPSLSLGPVSPNTAPNPGPSSDCVHAPEYLHESPSGAPDIGPSIVVFPVSSEPAASAEPRIHSSPATVSSTRRPFVPLVRQNEAPRAEVHPVRLASAPCPSEAVAPAFPCPGPDLEFKQQSSITRHRGSDFIRPHPPPFRPRQSQTFAVPSTPSRAPFSPSSPRPPQRPVFAVPATPVLPRIPSVPSTPSRASFSRDLPYPPDRPRFATPAPPFQPRPFAVPSTPSRASFSRSSQSPCPPERPAQQQAFIPPSTPSRASFSRSSPCPAEPPVFAPPPRAPQQPKPFAVPSTPSRASFSHSSPYPPNHEREVFARPATPVRPSLSAPSPRKRGTEFLPPARPVRQPTPTHRQPSTLYVEAHDRAPTKRGIEFLRPSSPVFRLPPAPASASPTKPSAYRNPAFYDTDAEWSTLPARKKARVEKPAIRSTGKFVLPLAAAAAAPPVAAVSNPSAGPSYLPPPPPPERKRVPQVEPKWRLTRVAADDYGLQLPQTPSRAAAHPNGFRGAPTYAHEVAVDLKRIERVYPTMRNQLAELILYGSSSDGNSAAWVRSLASSGQGGTKSRC